MRPQLRHFVLSALLFLPFFVLGQQVNMTTTGCPGVPGACGSGMHSPPTAISSLTVPNTPQNGNGTMGNIYSLTRCGLGYVTVSQRLGRRFSPQGPPQPTPLIVTGLPCIGAGIGTIEKAYLWAEGSGNGAAQSVTIAGPLGTATYPMTIVGQGPDKCWGYAGSYTYRADITPSIGGNGTYTISGLLTSPPSTGNDMDGASIVIVYSDATQNYQGTIRLDDGAIVVNSFNGTATYNMTYPAVCGPTTNASVFAGMGDLQLTGTTITLNATPATYTWNWWNLVTANTTVAAGQTNSIFTATAATGDCFNMCIAGLYYRTTCTVCTPAPALVLSTTSTPATCSQCNGTATVSVSPPGSYTYAWAPSGGTGSTATGLCAGTYTVTVSSPCASATAVVTVPILPGSVVVNNISSANVLCNGQCNGTATVDASGSTAPYAFSWSPTAPNTTTGNTNTATGLCAGPYVVTATDANGCTGTQTVNITQPTALAATSSSTPSACGNPNGSATVNPSGGVGGYTYSWNTSPVQSTQTATGLLAGTYNCIITDANGCTLTVSVTVGGLAAPTASLFIYGNVGCNGACDGFISINVNGGAGPYTTVWSPSGGNTTSASNLCPGTYTCNITDANNCPASFSLTITEPPPLVVTGTQTDVSCNTICDGTAAVTASGGSPGYTYLWSTTGGLNASESNLCAGNYTCDVSDVNGCTVTQSFTITEPTPLTVTSAGFNNTCFNSCDGQIVAIPSGGTPNYSFSWSTGCTTASCPNICAGTYSLTVTDAHGCTATSTATVTEPTDITITTSTVAAHCNLPDGSASATFSGGTGTLTPVWYNPATPGANLTNVVPGNYFVVVTDANGCDDTVNVTISNLQGVTGTAGLITPVSCFGGSDGAASVNATGGVAPYTYAWSCSASTTSSATGLIAGPCSVTITDASGCISVVTITITEPTQVAVAATAVPPVVCAGQNIMMTATGSGGTPNYTYAWGAPLNMTGATQNIAPTVSGPCTITVTDANGCVATTVLSYTVNPNPVAALTGDLLAGCSPLTVNFADQSSISAGTIVQWAWDFGDGNQSTQQNPSHTYLYSGFYTITLTVTSSTGCSTTVTMSNYINVYPTPVAAFSASPQPTTELNPTIYFTDMSTNASIWNWDFADSAHGSSTLQHPTYTYGSAGCFDVVLTAISPNGCIDSTMTAVCIDPDVTIYMPNAFTPDGDGINDYFIPLGLGLDPDKFEMWIFDRWGNLIFHTVDMFHGWDGSVQGHTTLSQQDVYVWKVKVGDQNGGMHTYIGHVTMIH